MRQRLLPEAQPSRRPLPRSYSDFEGGFTDRINETELLEPLVALCRGMFV